MTGPTSCFTELDLHVFKASTCLQSKKTGGKVLVDREAIVVTLLVHRRGKKPTHSYGFSRELLFLMGNKKNQRKSYNKHHRHVYRRKKVPSQKLRGSKNLEHKQLESIDGSRIVNLDQLQQYIDELVSHARQCQGSITLNGETRNGLASLLSSCCTCCGHEVILQTAKKVKGPNGYQRWECNLAAVWGQMSTGGGHSVLQESLSTIGVPVMSKSSFIHTERDIGESWRAQLNKSMIEAGKEESKLAMERNDYHHGVPAITVYVDGGWSKRSHKHSYNANSGVAIIIGKATGKLLYLGVRNKYCSACAQGIPTDKHQCYKNWASSSSEMETDILLEGFRVAESTHGVRYMRMVGDGDSSVYPTLLLSVPVWGRDIQKVECANHACKCYRSGLERLAQDSSAYRGAAGGLTKRMRTRLVSAARSAIRMRSKESDQKKAVKLLERGLINGPLHCFGQHNHCSPDFCTAAREKTQPTTSNPRAAAPVMNDDDSDNDKSNDGTREVIEGAEDTNLIGKYCKDLNSTNNYQISKKELPYFL